MDAAATSLCINLTAAGVAAGARVSADRVRDIFRQKKYDEDLEHVATVFAEELKHALENQDALRDTNELAGVTDDWEAVLNEIVETSSSETTGNRSRERDQIGHLFRNEEDAVVQIAEAIASVQGFDLSKTPTLREELVSAVGNAYAKAVSDFERRIAKTDLGDIFQYELELDIREEVERLGDRLQHIADDVDLLLTQAIRNEGFSKLSPTFFARTEPTPAISWRTTFSLADVHAGIPARRDGHSGSFADQELYESLLDSEDRIVVGNAGSGKSTLCKQVAIEWYRDDDAGTVIYRDSDRTGASFESRDALRVAIDEAQRPVLVVVEDAIRADANAILRVVDEYDGISEVSFLLDARKEELDAKLDSEMLDRSTERRYLQVADKLDQYQLPSLSKSDIERTIDAFERSTGKTVDRPASDLRTQIQSETEEGFGEFLLLSYHFSYTETTITQDADKSGLEAHVQSRYRTMRQPGAESALRDLSRFDEKLLMDVGVMVNLLNASGIGIYPELVHTLGAEYGHDIETHDQIADVRSALEGWFLFPANGDGSQMRTTHELWSTLYLRAVARDHHEQQSKSNRRERSDPHTGRCLRSLFSIFTDSEMLDAVVREFPDSPLLEDITEDPAGISDEYIRSLFGLVQRWPILVSLVGTDRSARYSLPECCPKSTARWVHTARGHAFSDFGAYEKANAEYERRLSQAREEGDRTCAAKRLNNLGVVARKQGAYDTAREHHHDSLRILRELDIVRPQAKSLNDLGLVAQKKGQYDRAREFHEDALEIYRRLDDDEGECYCLNNIALVAQNQIEYADAEKYHEASLAIERELDNPRGEAISLDNLGLVKQYQGEFSAARDCHQQSLAIFRDIGYRHGGAVSLNGLGILARREGSYERSYEYHEESLRLLRDIGDSQGVAKTRCNIGQTMRYQGCYDEAIDHLSECVETFERLDDKHGLAKGLEALGTTKLLLGDVKMAEEHLQESLAVAREINVDRQILISRAMLGAVAFELGDEEAGHRRFEASLSTIRDQQALPAELRITKHYLNALSKEGSEDRREQLCEDTLTRLREVALPLGHHREAIEEMCG
jgi:tetratricopeptide (TPR) repeat protein